VLPLPNGPLPVPGSDSTPDPTNPVYLQRVSNTMNALNSNLGTKPRQGNQASLGWTHTFSSNLMNEFHAGTSQDNQIATPTGLAPGVPTLILDSPASFILGNAGRKGF